jgi:MarR family 2-MHQ and catechol resistance regulon transcriptional repressor
MARTDPSTALDLVVVLARASNAVAEHARAHAAEHELSAGEFGVLEALYHKGDLLLGELQRKILVSSGGVTYLVDRLSARGLVERRDHPDDRRARHVMLTRQGRELMDRIWPEHVQRLTRAVEAVEGAERAALTGLLRRLGTHAAGLERPE